MIDEKFLTAAVNIRKTYISVTSDIETYERRIKITLDRLNSTLEKVESLQKDMKDKEKIKKMDSKNVLADLMGLINEIEDEGKSLEKYVEPLNRKIEKLSLEEQELYRMICDKHSNLTEDQIVSCVRERLIKEKLA
jgi:chromosome segregation ATPase